MKKLDLEIKKFTEHIGRKFSLKRHNKICKRNKKKPHDFVFIEAVERKWYGWAEYKCRHCGKITFNFSKYQSIV